MSETESVESIRMTDEGLEMPEELVGFTGQLTVKWPNEKISTVRHRVKGDGIPEVCHWICRGLMPSEEAANGVPGGHLQINGTLYEIEDARTEVDADA